MLEYRRESTRIAPSDIAVPSLGYLPGGIDNAYAIAYLLTFHEGA